MRSCVSLLSAVCGQPVEVMDRWLDLYYQVRHDKETADAAVRAAERLKEMEPLVIPGLLPEVDTRATARVAPTDKPGGSAEGREALLWPSPQAAAPSSPQEETKAAPVKKPGGKGTPRPSQIGNTRGHDAAVFKRQVRDRLEAARKKGVSAPELVRAAGAGTVTESDVYMILQGHVIKIDVYRALDEALRHFE